VSAPLVPPEDHDRWVTELQEPIAQD
jgi:hypothetical protein